MSAYQAKNDDLKSLSPTNKGNGDGGKDISTLKPLSSVKKEKLEDREISNLQGLTNPLQRNEKTPTVAAESEVHSDDKLELKPDSPEILEAEREALPVKEVIPENPLTFAEEQKERKKQKIVEHDKKLLSSDRWLARNGHTFTYVGIFLFSLVLYFRPYEWIPGFEGLTSLAMIMAVATLLIYVPTQLSTEGSLTILTTEVKCLLFIAVWAMLTMPLAKDPGLAWKTYSEVFIKIVLIFVIMANTIRTKTRLKGLMWLSIGIGVLLSFQAVELYRQGKFTVEGYRVEVDFGGMFGNPNDMALHLVMFTPIAVVLGIASKSTLSRIVYFTCAGLMVAGNMVTQSRGGFLGLIAIAVVLVWKLSKRNRVAIISIALVVGAVVITFAPGNYWLRILSIFVPALDPVGSSDQRKELLILSLIVTLRNPFGIGFGNFPIVGVRNLQTHNAFTQVSSELGWLAALAYVLFMVSPLRKLAAMERQMFERKDFSWMYYLSIGIQTTIIGYMVTSFFVSVAYQWFIYYPVAYAICLRRIYQLQQEKDNPAEDESDVRNYFKLQKA